jgi:Fe2+ or Zn2+ uptake regulation protein
MSRIAPGRPVPIRKRASIFPGAEVDRRVLDVLGDTSAPLGVYQIAEAVAGRGKGAAKAGAVYRSLDRLCELGKVERVETLSAYRLRDQERALLLIRRDTQQTTALPLGPLYDRLRALVADAGFQLDRLVLEAIIGGPDVSGEGRVGK